MNKITSVILLTLLPLNLSARNYDNEALIARARALAIPIVDITTVDSVFPTCEAIYPPEGCVGIGITNNESVPAQMVITVGYDTVCRSGPYIEDLSGLTLRVRGNTTAANQKKFPYKIKLQTKADLLLRGNDDRYKDKDWVLLNSRCYETLAGKFANRAVGMPWTPDNEIVFLILNGDFRGQYVLSENIKRNTKCRINVNKTGFIFEYDPYWWNEAFYIPSNTYRFNYTLKYPEDDEIQPVQTEYLTRIIDSMEVQMQGDSSATNWLQLPSFARWLMVHDILGDRDAAGSNIYFVKYDTLDSPVQMGPAWDFGGTFTPYLQEQWATIHDMWWFESLFARSDSLFARYYTDLYDSITAFEDIIEQLDSLLEMPLIATLDSAVLLDNTRWWPEYAPASEQISTMIAYLGERQIWMDEAVAAIRPMPLPVEPPVDPEDPPVDPEDGLDETRTGTNCSATKILRNGQLLIVKDGKLYTITGEIID